MNTQSNVFFVMCFIKNKMGNFEEQAKEELIKAILELTRQNIEKLNAEELEIVYTTLKN